MITLTPKTPGLFNPMILHRDYQLNFPVGDARTSPAKLVGGTTFLHDGGYTEGDREARVTIEHLTRAQRANLETMIESRADILFGTDTANFSARVMFISEPARDQAEVLLQIVSRDSSLADIIYPPEPVPPVPNPWHDYTSDTYWGTGGGVAVTALTWDGSKWSGTKTGAGLFIFALGDILPWIVDYRPSRFKITYTLTSAGSFTNYFTLTPTNLTYIFSGGTVPVSGQEYYIIQDADFAGITFTGTSTDDITLEITKIEFYPVVEWLERTSDTYWESFNGYASSVLCSWDGSEWFGQSVAGSKFNYSFYLSGSAANAYTYPWGSWADGYKPTRFSLLYEHTNSAGDGPNRFSIDTYPNFETLFRMSGFPVSGQIYELDWDNPYSGVPADHEALAGLIWLFSISAPADNSITISKIEFLD